jgi:mRNA-degrading endonuclease toxin of MazEF toxin-antitoxin module
LDKTRLVKRLGQLDAEAADSVLDTLAELFAK